MAAHEQGRVKMSKPFAMPAFFISATALAIVLAGPVASDRCVAEEIGVQKININPHDFSKQALCSVCHMNEPPALLLDPVTTCVKCHHGNIGNHPVTNHPMGQMARIKIPSYLPLTEDGQMVCYTCHDPHKKTKHMKMLRVDYFRLCMACHVGY